MLRIGMIVAAILLSVGATHADPITYRLDAVAGQNNGWRIEGTITFADGTQGDDRYELSTPGTEFDLKLVDGNTTLLSWKTGDANLLYDGIVRFQEGVIGDRLIVPDQDGSGLVWRDGTWRIRTDSDLTDRLPDTFLFLFADDYNSVWGAQDFTVPGIFGDFAPETIGSVEWQLRATPEPGSIVLFGSVLAGAFAWHRRRRRVA